MLHRSGVVCGARSPSRRPAQIGFEGVKRRQAPVRNAAPMARQAGGPVPSAEGTPAQKHKCVACRRAYRRFTAALFAHPGPRFSPGTSLHWRSEPPSVSEPVAGGRSASGRPRRRPRHPAGSAGPAGTAPRSATQRHRLTPSDEQGRRNISIVSMVLSRPLRQAPPEQFIS
jgi:hypothetical protein